MNEKKEINVENIRKSIQENIQFIDDIQRRDTNVVAFCLHKIFYKSDQKDHIIEYADTIGKGIREIWKNHFSPVICEIFEANGATLDKRISKYGTAMIGEPFAGFCFPKDIKALIKAFEDMDLDPVLLKAVKKVNDKLKEEKMNE